MNQATKDRIDKMTIKDLLYDQWFAPIGGKRFQSEEGTYRMKRLVELRDKNYDDYMEAIRSIGRKL